MNKQQQFIQQCKERFLNCYKELNGKDVILFAAGGRAQMMIRAFREMDITANIRAVLDNHCEAPCDLEGVPVYGSDRLDEFSGCTAVICSDTYRDQIKKQLQKNWGGVIFEIPQWEGMAEQMLTLHAYKTKIEKDPIGDIYSWIGYPVEEERRNFVYELLEDEKSRIVFEKRMNFLENGDLYEFMEMPVDQIQYFDLDALKLTDNEVFVDCGAYVGDTIDSFRKAAGACRKIIAFEPDKYNCDKIREYIEHENTENIHVINAAVGDENRKVACSNLGTAGSSVMEAESDEWIEQVRLDDVIQEPVTFLKMDIEGFELGALKGAEHLIKTYRPKLAICIYHKPEDPICITEYLKQIVPEYRFYMRHYAYSQHETVLYACV